MEEVVTSDGTAIKIKRRLGQEEGACAVHSHVPPRRSHGSEPRPEAPRGPARGRRRAASLRGVPRGDEGRLDSLGETRRLAVAKLKGSCSESELSVVRRDRRSQLADLFVGKWL